MADVRLRRCERASNFSRSSQGCRRDGDGACSFRARPIELPRIYATMFPAPHRAINSLSFGKEHVMAGQAFGVIGLEVMGRNVAQNIERNGFPVAVFNRTWSKTEDFMNGPGKGKNFKAGKTIEEFVKLIDRPRRILLMVKAGWPTDATIESIKPFLEAGDILIDGGNAI